MVWCNLEETPMMPPYIRVPLAIDLLLIALRQLFPQLSQTLPLGGSEIVQVAILMIVGIVVHELRDASGWRRS